MSVLFKEKLNDYSEARQLIVDAYFKPEKIMLDNLLAYWAPHESLEPAIFDTAKSLAQHVRDNEVDKDGIEAFMMHYDLSSEEGVVLMCLAEALLRIPDADTENLLIDDKLTSANWDRHLGTSASSFVNMATWGLALTGKVLETDEQAGFFKNTWKNLVKRSGEPVIRKAVRSAIKLLSQQFVLGRTIDEALDRSRDMQKSGYTFSYDMLGEAARTEADAQTYFEAYKAAIQKVGQASKKDADRPSISIKLSALHPRYEFQQQHDAIPALTKSFVDLALEAKAQGIALTMDAEEADRLDLSLDIFEAIYRHPDLSDWDGLGLAVQAYQKRALYVIRWLVSLTKDVGKIIRVRLVKGAYWDSEIKWSQMEGLISYPVFTRKPSTDLSYLVCAQELFAGGSLIYPQFATHNAYTVAAILEWVKSLPEQPLYEFQNLQGMGKALHNIVVDKSQYNIPCRIYAPVGSHEDLLPYLVRRLLENGANSSFVNKMTDVDTPIESLVASPIDKVRSYIADHARNPKIPLPKNLFSDRENSLGVAIADRSQIMPLDQALAPFFKRTWSAFPLQSKKRTASQNEAEDVRNPNDRTDIVGQVMMSSQEDIDTALATAQEAFSHWSAVGVSTRALILNKIADTLEANEAELYALLLREAGKTLLDAIAELREAVDFCRYYAQQAESLMIPQVMPGYTGESNVLSLSGRGVMLCISPWNFPLAIFTGQVVACLVTGNTVIAKPAEQTSLIASRVVELMHEAGVPREVLTLLPGEGETVGANLVASEAVSGVLFTGSTAAAKHIQRALANRQGPIVPLIAETGGLNAMIVDSSALPEQLVMDALESAFGSAGQRCSALRVLYLQEDIADKVIEMLKGAMALLSVDQSHWLSTDIGPVIDGDAKKLLQAHEAFLHEKGRLIYKVVLPESTHQGHFFAPQAYEIDSIDLLDQEVFGPILHVIRYSSGEIDSVIDAINKKGYGLTFGIQSRIETVSQHITHRIHAGNIYVNRNTIGAVVGVQPFGGHGLSGTGPKAGGPHYLPRLCQEKTVTIDTTAAGGNASLMSIEE